MLGSKIMLKYDGDINKLLPSEIAIMEFNNKIIPLKIKRSLPNGKYEIWNIADLI
jgi:DNA-directed RNA polymerase subunit K/omega